MEVPDKPFDKYCINCWSSPRCCSTSLMYSFAQRDDTQVLDEPLYASYVKFTGVERPYRDELLQTQETDPVKVVDQQILGPRSKKVLYAKHIGKMKTGISNSIFRRAQHMILIREPYGVLQSWAKVAEPTQQELGYTALLEIVSELRAIGRHPVVVLSDALIAEPEGMLRAICAALDLPFQESMLSWPAGPKPYDGLWAPWWYGNTHKSTGFSATVRDERLPLASHLKPLLGECQVMFELLRCYAIKPLSGSIPRPVQANTESVSPSQSGTPASIITGLAPAAVSCEGDQQTSTAIPDGLINGCTNSLLTRGVSAMKSGTHVYEPDSRNKDILVGIRDGLTNEFQLVWRPQAKVSVLDSAFMLGDGVWEGIRLHKGVLMYIQQHLRRLWEGMKAVHMDLDLTQKELMDLIYEAIDANGMADASGVHIRLMVSRGLKPTPYQNPKTTIGQPTIVILPEYKEAAPGPKEHGIRLFTVHVRRGPPDVQDAGWNSHSKLNCISACIQANEAGADEALMLDPHGFVATCNSTNFFIVRDGEVWAPSTKYQLQGITRSNVLRLAQQAGIATKETDFYLTQVYSSDEAFVTGTFAGLIPVVKVDGRTIGSGTRGPITAHLQQLYIQDVEDLAAKGRDKQLLPKASPRYGS